MRGTAVKLKHLLVCLLAMASVMMGTKVLAQADGVKLQHDPKAREITVTIGDEVFTVFHLSPDWPKPFASPAHAPGGVVMTRPIPKPGVKVDHPHHKGVWVAIDEVNKIKFWAEDGKIQNVKALVAAEGNPAKLTLVNHWLGEENEPLLEETTAISIFPNRLMVYDITFKALDQPVTFEDTKEGLFGIRLIDALREKETGKVINSDGLKGTKDAWGKTADWVDYSGQIDGKTVGAALFDHPDNFRPSRYHVRDYGLFTISPFGEESYAKQGAKPVTIEPGKSLNLKYGIYIHAGDTEAAKVSEVYQDFVKHAGGAKAEGKPKAEAAAKSAVDILKMTPQARNELKANLELQHEKAAAELENMKNALKADPKDMTRRLGYLTKLEQSLNSALESIEHERNKIDKAKANPNNNNAHFEKHQKIFAKAFDHKKEELTAAVEEIRQQQKDWTLFSKKAAILERKQDDLADKIFAITICQTNDKDRGDLKTELRQSLDAKTLELAKLKSAFKGDPGDVEKRHRDLLIQTTDLRGQLVEFEIERLKDDEIPPDHGKELEAKLGLIKTEMKDLERYSSNAASIQREFQEIQKRLDVLKSIEVE